MKRFWCGRVWAQEKASLDLQSVKYNETYLQSFSFRLFTDLMQFAKWLSSHGNFFFLQIKFVNKVLHNTHWLHSLSLSLSPSLSFLLALSAIWTELLALGDRWRWAKIKDYPEAWTTWGGKVLKKTCIRFLLYLNKRSPFPAGTDHSWRNF